MHWIKYFIVKPQNWKEIPPSDLNGYFIALSPLLPKMTFADSPSLWYYKKFNPDNFFKSEPNIIKRCNFHDSFRMKYIHRFWFLEVIKTLEIFILRGRVERWGFMSLNPYHFGKILSQVVFLSLNLYLCFLLSCFSVSFFIVPWYCHGTFFVPEKAYKLIIL